MLAIQICQREALQVLPLRKRCVCIGKSIVHVGFGTIQGFRYPVRGLDHLGRNKAEYSQKANCLDPGKVTLEHPHCSSPFSPEKDTVPAVPVNFTKCPALPRVYFTCFVAVTSP